MSRARDVAEVLATIVREARAGKISYNRAEAAAATGVSYDTIHAAIHSGHLDEHFVLTNNGKPIRTGAILGEDLFNWVASGPTEKEA